MVWLARPSEPSGCVSTSGTNLHGIGNVMRAHSTWTSTMDDVAKEDRPPSLRRRASIKSYRAIVVGQQARFFIILSVIL